MVTWLHPQGAGPKEELLCPMCHSKDFDLHAISTFSSDQVSRCVAGGDAGWCNWFNI